MNPLILEQPYKTSRNHIVSSRGHLLYEVTSASNPPRINKDGRQVGQTYTVDLSMRDGNPVKSWEYVACDCWAYRGHGHRPCRHGLAVAEALTQNILKIAAPTKKEPAQKAGKRYKLKDTKYAKR